MGSVFHEDRIFRIDHYLGKEAVQNLLALRFANSLFEPLWNASSIDNVQITVAETVGARGPHGLLRRSRRAARHGPEPHAAAGRAGRDGAAAPVRAERSAQREDQGDSQPAADHARPPSAPTPCAASTPPAVRGGVAVPGYNQEPGAKGNSDTETFVALRAEIDNWRWAGVPFYLRTGKRMQSRRTDIAIQFKTVPHNIFAADEPNLQANRLVIKLQPEESVTLEILSKQPGLEGVRLREVPLELSLPKDESGGRTRIAYERLLLDALKGNTTLFVRRDEVEAAWNWIDGIQSSWRSTRQTGEAVSCRHLGAHGRDRSDGATRPQLVRVAMTAQNKLNDVIRRSHRTHRWPLRRGARRIPGAHPQAQARRARARQAGLRQSRARARGLGRGQGAAAAGASPTSASSRRTTTCCRRTSRSRAIPK